MPQAPPRLAERGASDNVHKALAIALEDEPIVALFGHKDKQHSIEGRRRGQASGLTLGQTEDALADDVVLNLVGAGVDRRPARSEHPQ